MTNQCTDEQFASELRRAFLMIASALKKRYNIAIPLLILKGVQNEGKRSVDGRDGDHNPASTPDVSGSV